MTFARIMLWADGLVFLGIGVLFCLAPVRWARLVELQLLSPTARIDVRATYGGFDLAIGAFLIWCALRPEWFRAGLAAGALALAGFAFGRLVGMLAERSRPPLMLKFFLFEVVAAALTALACWRLEGVIV